MKFYTNNFIEYIYKEIYNYCWLLLITGLNLKSKSFTTYRVTLYKKSEVHRICQDDPTGAGRVICGRKDLERWNL